MSSAPCATSSRGGSAAYSGRGRYGSHQMSSQMVTPTLRPLISTGWRESAGSK